MKKLLLTSLIIFFGGYIFSQDLPGPPANINSMPAGSYVIAMDNTNQGDGSVMNVKAYGLVVTLLNNNVKAKWVIRAGKTKDGIDFTVNATRIKPTLGTALSYDFKAGPIVIFAPDTTGVAAMVQSFNAAHTPDVNLYRTNAITDVDVRYDFQGFKPKAALLNDGGNWTIHEDYLIAAGVPASNYGVEATGTNLLTNCYTFASEPHNTESPTAVIADIKNFVQNGGNFLAQCHAVETYENNVTTGHFQTNAGIEHGAGGTNNANIPITQTGFINADLSYSQFEGEFDMSNGGAMQNWKLLSGSAYINGAHHQVQWSTTPAITSASVSKLVSAGKRGGMVFYLGNHDYNKDATIQHHTNGIRMYLNAFLTPSKQLGSISFAAVVTCLTTLSEPSVLRVGSASGPINAYPLKFDLYADISMPYGRTDAGDVFLGTTTVNAAGGTGTVVVATDPYRRNTNYVITITPKAGCLDAIDFVPNSCSTALPVSLKTFTAKRDHSMVTLTWVTASEDGCRGFEIQRFSGTDAWENIGFVLSKAVNGTSSTDLQYTFSEINSAKGMSQYRLKQIDMDGNDKYSIIRSVPGENQERKIIIYPNPSEGSVNVVFASTDVTRDVYITDMMGRTIKQWRNLSANNLRIDNLNTGMYSLRVINKETGEQLVEKIIVNK